MNKNKPGLTNGTTHNFSFSFPLSLFLSHSPQQLLPLHKKLAYLSAPYKWKTRVTKTSLFLSFLDPMFPEYSCLLATLSLPRPHLTRVHSRHTSCLKKPVALQAFGNRQSNPTNTPTPQLDRFDLTWPGPDPSYSTAVTSTLTPTCAAP